LGSTRKQERKVESVWAPLVWRKKWRAVVRVLMWKDAGGPTRLTAGLIGLLEAEEQEDAAGKRRYCNR
jgi:hypothetical protein